MALTAMQTERLATVYFVPNFNTPHKPHAHSLEVRMKAMQCHPLFKDGRLKCFRAHADTNYKGKLVVCEQIAQIAKATTVVLMGGDTFVLPPAD